MFLPSRGIGPSAGVDRGRLGKERREDVLHEAVVLLLDARMRDPGHHGELLVRVGQAAEELDQVVDRGDAVILAAHHDRGAGDPLRVHHRQIEAHVDIGADRHAVVEGEDRVGEGINHVILGRARMVAREDRVHEGAVDRAALAAGEVFGELLASLFEGWASLPGPDEGIERETGDAARVALGEQRRLQRPGRDPVDEQRPGPSRRLDVSAAARRSSAPVEMSQVMSRCFEDRP